MTIKSFGNNLTEKIFFGVRYKEVSKFPQDVLFAAEQKLDMIQAAQELHDLSSPPASKLEELKGEMKEFGSIRINSQWRIIFKWLDDGPHEVQIIDYH